MAPKLGPAAARPSFGRSSRSSVLCLALLAVACSGSGDRQRPLTDEEFRAAAKVFGQVEIRPLSESLERIGSWLEQRTKPTAQTFHRGRRRSAVKARLQQLGLDPPGELFALYAWHDGQRDSTDAELIPGYRFLSLESAADEHNAMAQRVADGEMPQSWWSESYFPILEGGAGPVVVVCEGGETGSVLELSAVTGRAIGHPSLASFMEEIADGYEAGAYTIADDGALTRDEELELAVFKRYHPALPSRRVLSSDRELRRKVKKHGDGSRTVTAKLSSGATETVVYDAQGNRTSQLVEFRGDTVQEEHTEYDEHGRPHRRTVEGFLDQTVTWSYGDSGAVEIRRRTPSGTTVLLASLDDGEWTVHSSSFQR
jgi:YD repeat-containing protein